MGVSPLHLVIVLAVFLPVMFAPTIVAFSRNHVRKVAVLALNVLAGWTGIGWVAALVWALVGTSVPAGGRA